MLFSVFKILVSQQVEIRPSPFFLRPLSFPRKNWDWRGKWNWWELRSFRACSETGSTRDLCPAYDKQDVWMCPHTGAVTGDRGASAEPSASCVLSFPFQQKSRARVASSHASPSARPSPSMPVAPTIAPWGCTPGKTAPLWPCWSGTKGASLTSAFTLMATASFQGAARLGAHVLRTGGQQG